MSLLNRPAVQRVSVALDQEGLASDLQILDKSCRTPESLAKVLGVETNAIAWGVPCVVGRRFVVVFVAGSRDVQLDNLAAALSLEGEARFAAPEHAKATTGFPQGGIAPVGFLHPLPMLLDVGLKSAEKLYCPAGDPGVVMSLTYPELKRATKAIISYNVAKD